MNSTDQEILKDTDTDTDTDELDWSLNLNDFEVSLLNQIISDANETLPIAIPSVSARRYRGVYQRRSGNYSSELGVRTPQEKKRLWLGTFKTAEAAAMAYDQAAFKYRGPNAVLNFPHLIGKNKPSPELGLEGSPESSSNNHQLNSADFPAIGETLPAVIDVNRVARKRGFSVGQCKKVVSGGKIKPISGERYRGVGPLGKRFSAKIRNSEKRSKTMWLGTYNTAEEAAMAYDQAAIKYRGSHAVLNFPHLIGNNKPSPELELELELEGSPESSSNNHLPESGDFLAMGETPPAVSDLKGIKPKRGVSAGQCEEMVSGGKINQPTPVSGERYRGVGPQGKRFSAKITIRNSEKKREFLWLGTYDTAEEAAMAFDQAAVKYRGSAAVLNFPHLIGDDKLSPELESSPESSSDNHHLNGNSAAAV